MEALARDGRRAKALAAYEELVKVMLAELGMAPSPETEFFTKGIRENRLGEMAKNEGVDGVVEEPELPAHNIPAERTLFVGREK